MHSICSESMDSASCRQSHLHGVGDDEVHLPSVGQDGGRNGDVSNISLERSNIPDQDLYLLLLSQLGEEVCSLVLETTSAVILVCRTQCKHPECHSSVSPPSPAPYGIIVTDQRSLYQSQVILPHPHIKKL